jgi:hypothetical protein
VNTATIIIAGASAVMLFTIAFLAVLGFKALAAWMARLEARGSAKAEGEGFDARRRGEPASANPYSRENSEHFRGMARAWADGYARAGGERD